VGKEEFEEAGMEGRMVTMESVPWIMGTQGTHGCLSPGSVLCEVTSPYCHGTMVSHWLGPGSVFFWGFELHLEPLHQPFL
jgi:hypothetical protein